MKKILIPVVILAVLSPIDAQADKHRPDRPIRTFEKKWNEHNANAAAGTFGPTGDLFYPYGSLYKGRESVLALLTRELGVEGRMRESTLKLVGEPEVRDLGPKDAIVDVEADLTGIRGMKGSQHLWLTTVVTMTKKGKIADEDEWSIVAFRMMVEASSAMQK